MPKPCSVCNHLQSDAINEELLSGVPYGTITERYGTSKAALSRHKKHLYSTKLAPDLSATTTDTLSEEARETRNRYQREYRQAMSGEARAAMKKYNSEWRKKNMDKVREYNRQYWEKRAKKGGDPHKW